MNEFLVEAARIRHEAQRSPLWKITIAGLIKSNKTRFEKPISKIDMEACLNFLLDHYDPRVRISKGWLEPKTYSSYLEIYSTGNPFFSFFALDDDRKIKAVFMWDTVDRERGAGFLSKKYKWKPA